MAKVLVCWIGHADLKAAEGGGKPGLGPIGQAVTSRSYDEVALLSDHPKAPTTAYCKWLKAQCESTLKVYSEPLSSPTHFGEIYQASVRAVSDVMKRHGSDVELTYHLSPGTPPMAAVWVILAKTRFAAELIESSPQQGVKTASVPFDISAEFIPDLLRKSDRELERLSTGSPPPAPEFASIIHRSAVMKRVVARAERVAVRSVPVLIEGESGTGKELLARAIHEASPRYQKPFKAVNCGAIPSELVESELFGHLKGAFSGASQTKIGYFEAADGGTLFLDEIGELSPSAQVKILRALQEGEITKVGATTVIALDVRIIAATNRNLIDEVAAGTFRADLFYRLAVAILRLPALRERAGDLSLLIDGLLDQINRESTSEPGYVRKKISPTARNLLLSYHWPGNVRELMNTLRRAAIWSDGSTISADEVRDALMPVATGTTTDVMGYRVEDGLNLQELMAQVARHYLSQALEKTHGNKTKAAELLSLPNYQTFTNWLTKYNVKT
ncbi:sigma-54 interaction domain-containing protein [Desulfoferrobacter suflitae]|uniref:sigma-54 interaction domain-containing protein n=1 Tax=Desulfoferrobacter suflitae TaxID=2865782 RepID=UPI002164585D|nr:sigma-54 dependent transcriptional regulator [Desulfoferrobacter suflitae]MCK8601986.1 sigma-54 dependent transcriptional regulator [Desulfoferrobacter suflitae]